MIMSSLLIKYYCRIFDKIIQNESYNWNCNRFVLLQKNMQKKKALQAMMLVKFIIFINMKNF